MVLRRPAGPPNHHVWLNALAQHVAVAPPPPRPRSRLQKLEAWFGGLMTAYGEAELANSQAQLAAAQAEAKIIHDKVWRPTHEILLRHKLIADGVMVLADVVGVVAIAGFVLAAPELVAAAAAGSWFAGAALVSGAMAGTGSVVLVVIDGGVFITEATGHEAAAEKFEDLIAVQYLRISATLMLLPDLPLGVRRAVLELRTMSREAEAGARAAADARAAAEAQRARRPGSAIRASIPARCRSTCGAPTRWPPPGGRSWRRWSGCGVRWR